MESPSFIVATPARGVCDDNARALFSRGKLRRLCLGTRRGTQGVPPEKTKLLPAYGLAAYAAAKMLPPFLAESFRFGLLPWFDRWVQKQLVPGDHILSSYGYVNECFRQVRRDGGKTLLDAGNSHPEHYWRIVEEEYRRWGCDLPPFPRNWYERAKAMLPEVDYVLSPSRFVTRSFLEKGFPAEKILRNVYPVDLERFGPRQTERPRGQALTLISTAGPSLRKGAPYLFEAYRLVRKEVPDARLLVTHSIHPSLKPLMSKWADLPIEWMEPAGHDVLAERLRAADIFVLPSLEEGLVRTAIEAMACGLPVILTPHCGADDLVEEGVNGSVVPIRSAEAVAEEILKWWGKLQAGFEVKAGALREQLSYETFATDFLSQLKEKKLL